MGQKETEGKYKVIIKERVWIALRLASCCSLGDCS